MKEEVTSHLESPMTSRHCWVQMKAAQEWLDERRAV